MELHTYLDVCKNVCIYLVLFCRIMAAKTAIRISAEAHRILKLASAHKGVSLVEALDDITKTWEREHFFREMNNAFALQQEDPEAREGEKAERAMWDATLTDQQEDEHDIQT